MKWLFSWPVEFSVRGLLEGACLPAEALRVSLGIDTPKFPAVALPCAWFLSLGNCVYMAGIGRNGCRVRSENCLLGEGLC